MATQPYDDIASLVGQLSTVEKLRLVGQIMQDLEQEVTESEGSEPVESLYGLWSDLNIDISEEDIDQARREMWGNFPREDVLDTGHDG